jgi:hypothetical protein
MTIYPWGIPGRRPGGSGNPSQDRIDQLTGAKLSQEERAKLPYWDNTHSDHQRVVDEVYSITQHIHPGKVQDSWDAET